jgi:hypothetical protein
MLGIKFAGPFLNLLLNKKNTFDDLLQVDPDLYKSLAYIVAMEEEVESLELTFQYQDNLNKKIINLLPGGAKIKVHQYLCSYTERTKWNTLICSSTIR